MASRRKIRSVPSTGGPAAAADAALAALASTPVDDEPVTEAEEGAVAEAREDLRRGDVASHAELVRRLGL